MNDICELAFGVSRNKFYSSQEFKFQGLWSHEEAIAHGVDVGGNKTSHQCHFTFEMHRFTQTSSGWSTGNSITELKLSVCIQTDRGGSC